MQESSKLPPVLQPLQIGPEDVRLHHRLVHRSREEGGASDYDQIVCLYMAKIPNWISGFSSEHQNESAEMFIGHYPPYIHRALPFRRSRFAISAIRTSPKYLTRQTLKNRFKIRGLFIAVGIWISDKSGILKLQCVWYGILPCTLHKLLQFLKLVEMHLRYSDYLNIVVAGIPNTKLRRITRPRLAIRKKTRRFVNYSCMNLLKRTLSFSTRARFEYLYFRRIWRILV